MNYRSQWHQIAIFFFIITYPLSCIPASAYDADALVVLENNQIAVEAIKQRFPTSFCVEAVTFDSDVLFQKEEFFYVMGFKSGDLIDASALIFAIEYCAKKNKFSAITMTIISGENGLSLHFYFTGMWTFNKVKIRGVFQGKNMFSQCYVMAKGELFDQSKHDHSLTKIKELLMHQGYYNHTVSTNTVYDQKTKEITVFIVIKRGKPFSFGPMNVVVTGEDGEHDYDELQKELHHRLSHKLLSQKCSKEVMNREAVSLKSYLARKGFLQITINVEESLDKKNKKVFLQWKISLYQKREIVFFGNRFFSNNELLDKILAFGRSAWLLPASLLAEELISMYKNKGFWHAEVMTQEEKERSFFVIKEGVRAVIKSVEIHNAQHVDQSLVKKQCFSRLLKNKYYELALYDEAIGLLTQLYAKQGFLSCVVVDHNFVPQEVENEYTLVVTIDEGKKSFFASSTVAGYAYLDNELPFKKQVDGEGRIPFTMNIIDEQRVWLTGHFQSLGYLHPRIKSQIEIKDGDVFIAWIIEPGERIRFGKTIVLGSSRLPFSFISRFISYQQGQLWDQEKIRQTFKFFKDLDIFETIHLVPDYTVKDEEKPIILNLQLDDTYEVRARAGLELQHVQKYQTFSGLAYKIGSTALMKNPFNAGDLLRLDIDLARSHREIVGRYRRPLFLPAPCMGTIQVYSISYDQPGFVGSANDIYTLIQDGFFFGLAQKTKFFDVECHAGCEWMKTKIRNNLLQDNLARAINFKPRLIDKMVPFLFIEPTIMIESLDNGLNPTRGSVTLFSLKGMVPPEKKYKDSFFFKLLIEQSLFVPLKSVVAAFRFRFGHIFYREFSAIMPSERFYLGGSHSLRGYEADLAPPLGIFVGEDDDHVVPRGGKSMLNGNIELRFPLVKKIGGVIFQDFGILSGDAFADFKPDNLLAATGFGVRFFTPLGPLRFDMGWKWKKQVSFERSFAWFLTFGQAF
jgi:outer membrane protein insertion porin family